MVKSPPSYCILALLSALLTLQYTTVIASDYGSALNITLLFFEAQRSGKLPDNQRVKWRGDSGLSDGFAQEVNLVGGYYDAGDHVKFGLPLGFSITILSWAAIDFRVELQSLNQLEYTLEAIKWGTDYLIKTHTQPDLLWAQVGDGATDHSCWERPEDMTTPRTGYKLDPESPGSDLAGETAAALAAASLAFQPYDSSYSTVLLVHARQLFSFADRFRGLYDDSIQSAKQFYSSSGYSDELLWAATWLYLATNDEHYLQYAVENSVSLGGTETAVTEFSWDNKYAGVQVLLSKVLMEESVGAFTYVLQRYRAKAEYFACVCLQKNDGYNVPTTPGGLLYLQRWNNLQYSSSAAFVLAAYSGYLSQAKSAVNCPHGQLQPLDLLNFARSQADYILGKNPMSFSYLVGYGQNYPVRVHHRGASIPSISVLQSAVGCGEGYEKWYASLQANPNIIFGALVGGPNADDEFTDKRSNYAQNEPTLSGTAPLVGLLAKLHSLPTATNTRDSSKDSVYPQESLAATPVGFVHSITNRWKVGSEIYYRHKVMVKNVSGRTITVLKLQFENLTGPLWGLSPTLEKSVYELPKGVKALEPDSEITVVYVQGGSQAKIVVRSYQ